MTNARLKLTGLSSLDIQYIPQGFTVNDWSLITLPLDRGFRRITWSPELELFCCVANSGTDNRVMISKDGKTWSFVEAAANNNWIGVTWSPSLGIFAAVSAATGGTQQIMISEDGITWELQSWEGTNLTNNNIIWVEELGLFVVVAFYTNRVQTSPDGINWTRQAAALPSIANSNWSQVIWAKEKNLLVAVGSQTSSSGLTVMNSSNGIDWNNIPDSTPGCAGLHTIAFSPTLNLFVATAISSGTADNSKVMWHSYDGYSWFPIDYIAPHSINYPITFFQRIIWVNEINRFVATANYRMDAANNRKYMILFSTDGKTWIEQDNVPNKEFFEIAWAPEISTLVSVTNIGTTRDRVLYSKFLLPILSEITNVHEAINKLDMSLNKTTYNLDLSKINILEYDPFSPKEKTIWINSTDNELKISTDDGYYSLPVSKVTWDTEPDPFGFNSITNANLGFNYQSNAIIVTGINYPTTISLSANYPALYRINQQHWSSQPRVVYPGDEVAIELKAHSSQNNFTTTAYLTIGGVVSDPPFTVTTKS